MAVILHRPRTGALKLAGVATAIAAGLGLFCIVNAGLAYEWRICGIPLGCNYSVPVSPLPSTSVTLPNGSVLGIGVYIVFVLICSVVLAVAALAYAHGRGWADAWCYGPWPCCSPSPS